jgi:hypothetical protein
MPDIGGIQLLPETRKKINYRAPGQNRYLFFSLGFVALIFAIYMGLKYYSDQQMAILNDIDNKLVANEEARSKTDEAKLMEVKASLDRVTPLLTGHILLSQGLTHMQSLINPKVQFSNLSVNVSKKEYAFKGKADSFAVVAKQLAAFYADKTITNVNVSRMTVSPDGIIDFGMTLNFNIAELLLKQ